MRIGVSLLVCACAFGSLAVPAVAHAQVANETFAETLFQEAKTLIEQGDYARACPKLADSQRADPAGGTVLLLAVCYEKIGKTASAWLKFNEALAMARADRRADREKRAKESLAALEPRLSRVHLAIAPDVLSLEGLMIVLDNTPIPNVGAEVRVPMDPGEHVVHVKAKGFREFVGRVTLVGEGVTETLTVTSLAREATPPREASPAPSAPSDRTVPPARDERTGQAQRLAGLGLGAAGVLSIGFGTWFGVRALDQRDEARSRCPDSDACFDERGVDASTRAVRNARASTGFIAGGVLAAGACTLLLLTAPRSKTVALWVAPQSNGAALGALGHF
jgi:hypothetical protein